MCVVSSAGWTGAGELCHAHCQLCLLPGEPDLQEAAGLLLPHGALLQAGWPGAVRFPGAVTRSGRLPGGAEGWCSQAGLRSQVGGCGGPGLPGVTLGLSRRMPGWPVASLASGVEVRDGGGMLLWCSGCGVRWWESRRDCNRRNRALHGNRQVGVVVANITALSNLRLALVGEPDVALLQEVRATKAALRAEAKKFGYVAVVGGGELCLAAVLFKPGRGQELRLSTTGVWADRVAAAIIHLGDGHACRMASVYGYDGPTAQQRKELSEVVTGVLYDFRALGKGPCLIAGDFNALPGELEMHEL